MYRYETKSDDAAIESPNHANLNMISSPRTKLAQRANSNRRQQKREQQKQPTQQQQQQQQQKTRARNMKLNHLEVGEFCLKNNITNKTELFAEANKRKHDGEHDLALYVFSNPEVRIEETIAKAWKMQRAEESVADMRKDRLQRLREAQEGRCTSDTCTWYDRAVEVLRLNNIDIGVYAKALFDCLVEGRRKERNVMLIGSANTGKTFMLKPLQVIFQDKLFENPSSDKYGWLHVQDA